MFCPVGGFRVLSFEPGKHLGISRGLGVQVSLFMAGLGLDMALMISPRSYA